ncbi:MAG: hypothetical protein MJ166_06755 [Clostridia bacterium]|nr:hypothetical protein [Clostridia bacterium]
MKIKTRFICSFLGIVNLFVLMCSMAVSANTNYAIENNVAQNFLESIVYEEDFQMWSDASLEYGYELYNYDCTNISSILFHVEKENDCVGYIIVDHAEYNVVEFSAGNSPYENIDKNDYDEFIYLYENATSACSVNGTIYYVESDGSLSSLSDTRLRYNPNLQGNNNCIVAAISNLLWYYGGNGYSSLTSGKTFNQLMSSINSIILAQGGYANNNIPNTISNYVNNNTSYSVTVNNVWNPTLNDLLNEVVSRPCLLGFSSGSPYSATVGHMTVCVGTTVQGGKYYVEVMDGHSTSIQYKLWGTYNNFISKVVFN